MYPRIGIVLSYYADRVFNIGIMSDWQIGIVLNVSKNLVMARRSESIDAMITMAAISSSTYS